LTCTRRTWEELKQRSLQGNITRISKRGFKAELRTMRLNHWRKPFFETGRYEPGQAPFELQIAIRKLAVANEVKKEE